MLCCCAVAADERAMQEALAVELLHLLNFSKSSTNFGLGCLCSSGLPQAATTVSWFSSRLTVVTLLPTDARSAERIGTEEGMMAVVC